MLRHKNIDRICCAVLAVTILLTCGVMGAVASGLIQTGVNVGYQDRLFDTSKVHTIDILMDDWDEFIENCVSEEYSPCTLVVDGEKYGTVAIRGKGNTSLSSVANYGNDRYSFKVEFDHYQSGRTYYGLDKLCLNNLIQDKTYMKDYLAYTLMNRMGVAAPLCSFVQINVNGEAWGVYLAVEGIEDGFLERNYGSESGNLYKPDSMSFGAGRGNGGDFDMDAISEMFADGMSEMTQMAEALGFDMEDLGEAFAGGVPNLSELAENFDFSMDEMPDMSQMNPMAADDASGEKNRSFGGMGAMGSSDVMLQYIDDDPESYSNIFNNAKTDVTQEDQQRLIESLKTLSEGEQVESVVDTNAVIRYLVVHNFLCNGDSYTGSMVHNYYLYEDDGVLSMIPWDYNLAFGAFGGSGFSASGATSEVNSPIDSPVSSGEIESRPMIAWIFAQDETLEQYHEAYAEFINLLEEDDWLTQEIQRVQELIAPYVEAETRAFYTYEEFENGVEHLIEFCELRCESIRGQLDGSIPSTSEGQKTDSQSLIDASAVDLSAMGEFNQNGGKGGMGGFSDREQGNEGRGMQMPEGMPSGEMPMNGADGQIQMPEGMTSEEMPMNGADGQMQMPTTEGEGMQVPEGMQFGEMPMNGTDGQMQMPTAEGESMTMPEDMTSEEMPMNGTDGQMQMPEGMPSGEMPMNGMNGQMPMNAQTSAMGAASTDGSESTQPAERPSGADGEMPTAEGGAMQMPMSEGGSMQTPEGMPSEEVPMNATDGQTATDAQTDEADSVLTDEAEVAQPDELPSDAKGSSEEGEDAQTFEDRKNSKGRMQGQMPSGTGQGNQEAMVLLIASVLALMAGIVFAKCFKNHR